MANPALDVAVLEVARGGIAKCGLATEHVQAALVLNLTADHLGLNGVDSVEDLARVKFTVHNAVRPGGRHLVNLDDELSRSFSAQLPHARAYFSQHLSLEEIKPYLRATADYACWVENGQFKVYRQARVQSVAVVDEVGLTYNGLAKHNIENILASICLSLELGCSYAEISAGLVAFDSSQHNQGRFNVFEVKGAKIIIDYGHNLAAIERLLQFARGVATRASKLTLLLGFSGDRKFMVDSIVQAVIKYQVDYVILKLFTEHLRGAEVGELAALLQQRLLELGYPAPNILATVATEMEALALVFSRLEPEHIYILLCQDQAAELIHTLKNSQ